MRIVLFDKMHTFDKNCEALVDGSIRMFVNKETDIKKSLYDQDLLSKIFEEDKMVLDKININKNKFLKNIVCCEYVQLSFEEIDIIDYIENNEFLKDKKIILDGKYFVKDYDKVKELMEKYNKYLDRIYIKFEGDYDYTNIVNAYETIKIIKNDADYILSLNPSNFEKVFLAFDYSRKRKFKKEDKNESYKASRNLSMVSVSDTIVCKGFASTFDALCNYMGINSELVIIDNNKGGHALNRAYINDPKYNVDGVYYFDTTWDCKKDDTNDYLNSYGHFGMSKVNFDHIYRNYNRDFVYNKNTPIEFENDVKKFMESDSYSYIDFHNYIYGKYKFINILSQIIDGRHIITEFAHDLLENGRKQDIEPILKGCEKVIKEVKSVYEKHRYTLSLEQIIHLFSHARKIEYYVNPDLYNYDVDTFIKVCKNSGFRFTNNTNTIYTILTDDMSEEGIIRTYLTMNGYSREIEAVRLTKVLSNYVKTKK